MKCLLPLLILIDSLYVKGILEWTVVGKVTDYGQNVTLFCNVPHCCPKDSGWDRWTPVQQTLFIDIKTGRPNKKYDGKVMKDGYTLIIQNLTENDLNVSYSCLYGVTLGERKFLLEEDVFNPINPTQPDVPNGQLSQSEISALIIGVIVLLLHVLGSVTISIYLWRRRIKRNKSTGNTGKSGSHGIKVNSLDIETDQKENEDCSDPKVKLLEKVTEQKELENNSDLKEKIINIETEQEQCIPKNIRDLIHIQIKDWKKKDKMFVSTKASDYVMECLQDNSCVTLTAPSGAGKSFISRHAALILQKKGYRIIPVYYPTDIRDYYKPGEPTVFIVDDICGNFVAHQSQIENWKQLLPVIDTVIADKCCKIIVSCRLQVYKDDKFNILVPFKSRECNLTSYSLCLTSVEKQCIAKQYIGTSINEIDVETHNSDFFPLLCSLYHDKKHVDVNEFFNNPFDVYKNDLDKLSEHGDEGNYKICGLALCVLFNNQLEEKWFQGKVTDAQQYIIEDICNACDINRSTSKSKLNKALDTLDGTFICTQNGMYRTIHDKLFDFLAHYFGQKMIECLINHGDSDLVHQRFIWQKSDDKISNIDFINEIPDDYLDSYLQRFIKDWLTGKVADVFSNNNMKVSSFRQKLIQYLQQLDRLQQVKLASTKDTMIPLGSYGSGLTPLTWNCHDGYTDMVQWMLHNDVDVNQCRDDGVSGLFMASPKGHTDIVKLLLERNADVNLCNNDDCSPLLQASQNGHTDIVKLLLERNADVNLCNNDDCSPLLQASQNGHTDIVKLLLERNADVNLCDKDGMSPLLRASDGGHTDIVKLLLERNPDVNQYENDGCSPLLQASQNGHTDIVNLLLERNPDVNLCDKDGMSPLLRASDGGHTDIVKLLLERNPDVNQYENDGCSPLLQASQNGHTDIVKLLLERNPDVNQYANDGCSPLLQASQNGHTDIVKLLLERNPDVNLCNKNGCSPLLQASDEGHTDIVKLLLGRNPDVNQYDNDGCSPLIQASQNGHTDIVRLLLERNPIPCDKPSLSTSYVYNTISVSNSPSLVKPLMTHKPDVNAQTYDGGNALYFSAKNGNIEITQLLLENNAYCNICIHNKQSMTDIFNNQPELTLNKAKQRLFDSLVENTSSRVTEYVSKKSVDFAFDVVAGSSPLHIACFMGRTDIVRCLIDCKSNINMKKEDGTTPLFYACEVGHKDIVLILLDKGADTQICRIDDKTPLGIATENKHTCIVVILTEHMKKENAPL